MKQSVIFLLAWAVWAVSAGAANPPLPTIPSTVFNVTNYGALGDGVKDNTTNIQNAINAANAAGGGVVEIPAGAFLSGPITLLSDINLQIDTDGMLQMLPLGTYPGGATNAQTFIGCNGVQDVEISGWGKIDGQGAAWWTYFNTNSSIVRPMMLNLYNCDRMFIHDITYQNPPYHHCGLRSDGGNITISNLTVNTESPSPNTDGLNFVGTNCVIENCHISDGDDNIAMGSTGPLIGLVITNCQFGTGHGVSIGSGIDGVTNLTVVNCGFNGTGNGLRIKCAQDNSLPMRNLNYANLAMTNVGLPIVFYSYYNVIGTPDNIPASEVLAPSNTLPVNATTPDWSGITISNVTATSTDIGGIIWGPTEQPIRNVTLARVNITAPKTFDLYNVQGILIIDSVFNFSSGPTFTLCNAGLTVSNSTAGGRAVTIGGAASSNSLALFNANAAMSSSDAFACNPITLSGSMLTNTGSLTFSNNQVIQFALGTNINSQMVVVGSLTLNGTLDFADAGGFTVTNYVLFTYSGGLSGVAVIGTMPAGYAGALNTATAGQVKLTVTRGGRASIVTTNTIQSAANPSSYGTAVTFTATVTPAPTNGETVVFEDGATVLGDGTLAGGVAGFTTGPDQLAAGVHAITAVYSGDGAYEASASAVLTQTVIEPAGTDFNDAFSGSTVDSADPSLPTRTAASYEVLAGKSLSPLPSISNGTLGFGMGATSSGVIEAQALFASPAVALVNTGDFIRLSVTFSNTAGILSQPGVWGFGLYDAGGVLPIAGGLNGTLNDVSSNAAVGGAQNWRGYFAQIAYSGGTSGFYSRQPQTGADNNNQDLVSFETSSSYANPAASGVGAASTAPSVALAVGGQYTEILTFTLTSSNAIQLASQLYAGAGGNGAPLSSMAADSGVAPLATAFDALAIGWRATGSTPSDMTVSSILVTSGTAAGPNLSGELVGRAFTLAWAANYSGWLLQSNSSGLGSANWVTLPAPVNGSNYSTTIDSAKTNVFYRLMAP